jgi:hypothetical protein
MGQPVFAFRALSGEKLELRLHDLQHIGNAWMSFSLLTYPYSYRSSPRDVVAVVLPVML